MGPALRWSRRGSSFELARALLFVDPTSRLEKKGPTELWDPTWVPHFRGPL
jgi:hypothetical protein